MRVWLYDGPLDGAVFDVPALAESMSFWCGDGEEPAVYLHEGPPNDPDRYAPDAGNELYYQGPDQPRMMDDPSEEDVP
jgi:hypothetical protein